MKDSNMNAKARITMQNKYDGFVKSKRKINKAKLQFQHKPYSAIAQMNESEEANDRDTDQQDKQDGV